MGHNTDVGTGTFGALQNSKVFSPHCVRTVANELGSTNMLKPKWKSDSNSQRKDTPEENSSATSS